MNILLGAQLATIEGEGRAQRVVLASGEQIDADLVVAGIGIDAETALAEQAGLACDAGIVVDESYRTSTANILAIGDCSRHPNDYASGLWRLESVQHANDSAEIAAEVILGAPRAYRELPTFWSDQYDLKLQAAGIARDVDETIIRGDPENGPLTVIYLRGGQVIAADAINCPRDFMASRALIRNGVRPDPALLADVNIPLKSLA